MRVIKFRGKRIDNGEWICGDLSQIQAFGKQSCYIATQLVTPEIIGQFTGLKDKNGVEIFEGDVVMCHSSNRLTPMNPNSEMITGKVYHDQGCWVVENEANKDCGLLTPLSMFKVEIIGNIHESTEC